jgi:hypothetical protein
MDRIRWLPKPPYFKRDVEIYLPTPLGSGVLWVKARSGGASTSETPLKISSTQKNWVIQAGETIDNRLDLTEQPLGSGHWVWEPVQDMPYVDYHAALTALNGLFK